MTTRTHRADLAVLAAGALLLVASCQEPVPGAPTYTVEIKPLMEAHCVRCHSADGVDGGTGMDPRALNGYATDKPASHLNSFSDVGDCDPDAAASVPPVRCVRGAQFEALQGPMQIYVHSTSSLRMPLPPSEPLTSWELSLLDNWIANGAKE